MLELFSDVFVTVAVVLTFDSWLLSAEQERRNRPCTHAKVRERGSLRTRGTCVKFAVGEG